jgi:transposase
MEVLTLSAKEQNRLQILNGVLEQHWSMRKAAPLLGVSERQGWRLLAAYRKEGARGLAHKNRGRMPPNATPKSIQQQVVALALERYERINHTHLSELLAEREGLTLSRHGKADPGAGWIEQPSPPPATTTSVSKTTDASGGDAAPT